MNHKEKKRYSRKLKNESDPQKTSESSKSVQIQNNDPNQQQTTPKKSTNQLISEDEYSPYFTCSTQEIQNGVDVLWDWNQHCDASGSTTPVRNDTLKKQKKLLTNNRQQQSPKLPLIFRRHASNNNEKIKQDFDKLREELNALKEELAHNEHDVGNANMSQQEVTIFKSIIIDDKDIDFVIPPNAVHEENKPLERICMDDSIFDDNMDDQLLLCSQVLENNVLKHTDSRLKNYCLDATKSELNTKNNHTDEDDSIFDDSFNMVLSQIDSEFDVKIQNTKLNSITTTTTTNYGTSNNNNKKIEIFSRTRSETNIRVPTGKTEFQRTHSFEVDMLSKETIMEIERKRLEAKARLEAKKQGAITNKRTSFDTPIKCSAQEIERKRLEARAKLDAKRNHDVMEKKRLEALKRLEDNRRKKSVKQNLSQKL